MVEPWTQAVECPRRPRLPFTNFEFPVKHDSHAPVLHIGVPNPIFEGDLNVYVIAGDPLTLVDTGIGTPEALESLESGLTAHGLALADIRQVLLTHKHADHIGLAADIRERSGSDRLRPRGRLARRRRSRPPPRRVPAASAQAPPAVPRSASRDRQAREVSRARQAFRAGRPKLRRCKDGDRFEISGQTLEVIHTPGHTQGCVSFRYGNHLFTGDHVLPTISPNIGAGELRRTGMMQRYLDALDRIATYQTDELIALPGHGPAFSNLAERCGRATRSSPRSAKKRFSMCWLRASGR